MQQGYKTYSSLSGIAQRAFCVIENKTISEMKEEVYITKEDLAWELQMSIPNVKLAVRELKRNKFISPRNINSSWVRIAEEHRIGGARINE